MIQKIMFFLLLFFSVFVIHPVEAGVTCTGQACSFIPANVMTELQSVDHSLKAQYTDKVMSSMADAAVLTSLNSGLIGKGYLSRFELGVGLAAAAVKKDDITVVHGSTEFPKLPNAGASFSPVISLGVNLGWLLGKGKADTKDKKFLHKFNLYAHGFSYKYSNKNVDKYTPEGMDMNGTISNAGFMVRYQVFDEKKTKFSLLGFNGVSIGAGYYVQNQSINIDYKDQKVPTIKFGAVNGSWAGENKLDFQSKIRTAMFDVRTGIRLFYVLTLFTGIGTSVNNGNTDLSLERTGTYRAGTDMPTNPELAKYMNSAPSVGDIKGDLALSIKGNGRPTYRTNYLILGTELNISAFKILLEGYAGDKTYSATLGFKFSF